MIPWEVFLVSGRIYITTLVINLTIYILWHSILFLSIQLEKVIILSDYVLILLQTKVQKQEYCFLILL